MWPCDDEYSRDQAIAQSRIPKYRGARANEGRAMAKTGLTDAETGVDLDVGKKAVALIKPLLGSTVRANSGAAVAYHGRLYLYR
jgi:hypothetical protein